MTAKEMHDLLQRAATAAGLPAGSDITRELVPAITRMREALEWYAAAPPRGEYQIHDKGGFLTDVADWCYRAQVALNPSAIDHATNGSVKP